MGRWRERTDWWVVLAVVSAVLAASQVAAAVVGLVTRNWAGVAALPGTVFWYWIGVGAWRRRRPAATRT